LINPFLTKPNYIRIYGHRGARGDIVENSISGFKYTFDLGIKAVEFDVVISKDNIPTIFHDYRLNPDLVKDASGNWITDKSMKLVELTYDEISKYSIGSIKPETKYAKRFKNQKPITGEKIPKLTDLFKLVTEDKYKDVFLNLEIKSTPTQENVTPDPEKMVSLVLKDIKDFKNKISKSKISISDLVSTAWASASTFRGSDKRGGANGARIMLEPQKNWAVNNPEKLSTVVKALNKIKDQFDNKKKSVSMADLIVLAGGVGIEMAAKKAGHKVNVPFSAGRGDARQDQTDIHSFGLLEPQADGFRNYLNGGTSIISAEEKLVDKAQLMCLTAPEMTALIGGMRVLNTNYDGSNYGVFTNKPGSLTNDYFVNLLDMNTTWKEEDKSEQTFVGRDRKTKKTKWKATRVDLIFGSNSQLRALAEVYACEDSSEKFVKDFIAAWVKVMNSDRFDLKLN